MRATEKFLNGFEESFNKLRNGEDGVYYWEIEDAKDDNNVWAIVLGWAQDDSAEKTDDDKCKQDGWCLAVKIAFQSINAMLQCDYVWDWPLPYDKKGDGELADCEWYLSDSDDFRKVLKNVVADWNKNKKQYIKMIAE